MYDDDSHFEHAVSVASKVYRLRMEILAQPVDCMEIISRNGGSS